MSTRPVTDITHAWCSRTVPVFMGLFDSKIETGEDYATKPLAAFFSMAPLDRAKAEGPAFVPSLYHEYDAREHAAQREHGSFVALTGDIDGGNHGLEAIKAAVMDLAGDAAWLIYSSPHARPDDKRWRILLPLDEPQPFSAWHDAQCAFFAFMESRGFAMDHALARAAQPVFLPNVPRVHTKTGTALRGGDGAPLHYVTASTGTDAPGLSLQSGVIASGIAAIRRQRMEDEKARDAVRREAEARRANKPRGDGGSIIEDFNASNSVATMLEICGYIQSPRNADDWRSPQQTGETYATRIIGSKWVSLSASDAASGLGERCQSGCFGDAYDLFVHYKHGGNNRAAVRALYDERRASNPNVIYPQQFEPPAWMDEAPAHDEMPEWAHMEQDAEPVGFEPVAEEEAAPAELRVVDAFAFDEEKIPPRPWIIPGALLSGYTHMLVAPGGSGKSLFTLQLAITLAEGEPWGEFHPRRRCKTLLINVEDDLDEQRRRLAAARRVMDPDMAKVAGMIHLAEDPDTIVVARSDVTKKTVCATPIVDVLRRYIIDNEIDVLIVDPFAETFEGDENSNSEVKWAMKIWRDEIARATGCAVYLVHHTTKHAGNGAGDADIIRGAGAIVNSTRISATLMPMTSDEAEAAGINPNDRHMYVRYDDAKANQSLKNGRARWFEKVSVNLSNGTEDVPADEVGALRPWRVPTPFDGLTSTHLKRVQQAVGAGQWRENQQANEWVGHAVADALMLNIHDQKDRKRIAILVREWIKNDVLRVVEGEDAKRMKRKFVEVGTWITN